MGNPFDTKPLLVVALLSLISAALFTSPPANFLGYAVITFIASVAGIFIGMLLSFGVAYMFNAAGDTHVEFSYMAVVMTFLFSLPGIGMLVSGLMDASLPGTAFGLAILYVIAGTLFIIRKRLIKQKEWLDSP